MSIASRITAIEEGFRSDPYLCSEGYPTVGYGQKIGGKDSDLSQYEFEIPEPVARLWMEMHLDQTRLRMLSVTKIKTAYNLCNEERKAILLSMAYQMGVEGLLKFKKMLAAIVAGDFEEAAAQGLDSKWARQTPNRAQRHMDVMRTGELVEYYA